ncbi:ABC transporter permease [Paenibacillus sp. MMS20-IR301]|uniref:ABC transporter permease n=1 Tax=Paenibacillus sp. MMS20-IR301 TaxID=2895946 RepID=UPI0028E23E07|nr:ABC transporter permease [Paenibacillus sp. MMS20-IR301]WNS45982.1 ABC transporter permease [Paenibacillus sp. MMS20-IR301]
MKLTAAPEFRSYLHTIKVHMKLSLARPMFQFIIFLSPFLFSTIAILIYGKSSSAQIFQYVVLGSGFITLWSSIVFSSASDVNREKYYGTLELLFTAPVPFGLTLAGKITANTLWGLLSMLISYVYLAVFYRVPMVIGHPLHFILAYLFVLCSLSVFSFFLAILFTLSRQAYALMNMLEYPVYLLCGFMFPVTLLPDWIKPVSWMLPPTWAIELLRMISRTSAAQGELILAWGVLLLLTVIYLIISLVCYRLVEKRARIHGNLGVF